MGDDDARAPRATVGRLCARILAATLTAILVIAGGGAAGAAYPPDEAPEPTPGSPWFGGDLAWDEDSATRYSKRLGTSVSLLSRSISYPLGADSTQALRDLASQASEQGAVAVVSLEPTVDLDQLSTADAEELLATLNPLTRDLGVVFLARFAPEMNGTWTAYGQQPTAYVDAFAEFAHVVHDQALATQTVWAPAYGGGYPFGGSIDDPVRGAVVGSPLSATDRALLDTNNNLRLDRLDDPYGPYFPGTEAVDWVGLTMLRYGAGDEATTNTVPGSSELQQRLDDRFDYPASLARPSFYQRYAVSRDKPMMLVTGAAYNAAEAEGGGPGERAVKGVWLRRILTGVRSRPEIGAVVWLEQNRTTPGTDSAIRWGLTSAPALGRTMGRLVSAGGFDLGPVTHGAPDTVPAPDPGPAADQKPAEALDARESAEPLPGERALRSAAEAAGLSMFQVSLLLLIFLVTVTLWLTWRIRQPRMRQP